MRKSRFSAQDGRITQVRDGGRVFQLIEEYPERDQYSDEPMAGNFDTGSPQSV
jgi:hypothetical protein